jgi:nicotinamidase-related amidase
VTSLTDRPDTALVVIDMQQGVVRAAYDVDRVVTNINTLIAKRHA